MRRARPAPRSAASRARRPAAAARKRVAKAAPRRAPSFRLPVADSARVPLLVLLVGLLLAALWLPFAPFSLPRSTRLWRGYQTLLVRVGSSAEHALPAALRRLGAGVVSEQTTTVDFYDFSGQSRTRLADLSRRLDPEDPRHDPYMDRIKGYFNVTSSRADWRVAYIPARSGPLAVFLTLRPFLGPSWAGGWRLAELDPVERLIACAAVLAFAVILSASTTKRRRGTMLLGVLGAALWVPAVVNGPSGVLALCLIVLTAWLPLAYEWLLVVRGETPGVRQTARGVVAFLGTAAGGVTVFLALAGFSVSALTLCISPVAGSLLLLGALPLSRASVEAWRVRRARVAIPHVPTGADPQRGRFLAIIVGLSALALSGLLPLARGGACPVPVPLIGVKDFSWHSLQRLQARGLGDRLPDISDYVAHEAYQQGLGYGRKWAFPLEDERVYEREYLLDQSSGVIQARLRTVKVFDSPWLAAAVSRPAPGSVEALLAAQGRPVAAAVQGPAGPLSRSLPFTIIVFCVLFALLGRDLGLGPLIRDNLWRLNSEARRDQVP